MSSKNKRNNTAATDAVSDIFLSAIPDDCTLGAIWANYCPDDDATIYSASIHEEGGADIGTITMLAGADPQVHW
jgi:hypothetical protein